MFANANLLDHRKYTDILKFTWYCNWLIVHIFHLPIMEYGLYSSCDKAYRDVKTITRHNNFTNMSQVHRVNYGPFYTHTILSQFLKLGFMLRRFNAKNSKGD